MKNIAVWIHIGFGSIALSGMLLAWLSKKGGKWHRLGGKAYVFSMALALIVATVVSVATSNIFLGLIGLFSAYLVYTGWRVAQVRDGVCSSIDRGATALMIFVAVAMGAYGVWMLSKGNSLGIALIAFAFFGGLPALADWRNAAWPKGRERIVLHLNRMGAGSIATLTAVFVVNVQTTPAFIAWLLPSVVVVPLIIYFTRQQRGPVD